MPSTFWSAGFTYGTFPGRINPGKPGRNQFLPFFNLVCPGVYFLLEGALGLYELVDGTEINYEFFLVEDFEAIQEKRMQE